VRSRPRRRWRHVFLRERRHGTARRTHVVIQRARLADLLEQVYRGVPTLHAREFRHRSQPRAYRPSSHLSHKEFASSTRRGCWPVRRASSVVATHGPALMNTRSVAFAHQLGDSVVKHERGRCGTERHQENACGDRNEEPHRRSISRLLRGNVGARRRRLNRCPLDELRLAGRFPMCQATVERLDAHLKGCVLRW
jgi:hypothetical protein